MRGMGLVRMVSIRVFTRFNNAINGKTVGRTKKQKYNDRLALATEIIKTLCG